MKAQLLDVAGFPSVKGRDLVDGLVAQAATADPTYLLDRTAATLTTTDDGVVVGLDDGTSVRSNVVNCEPDPERVKLGMKVKLTTYSIGADDEGTEAIAFGYEPA